MSWCSCQNSLFFSTIFFKSSKEITTGYILHNLQSLKNSMAEILLPSDEKLEKTRKIRHRNYLRSWYTACYFCVKPWKISKGSTYLTCFFGSGLLLPLTCIVLLYPLIWGYMPREWMVPASEPECMKLPTTGACFGKPYFFPLYEIVLKLVCCGLRTYSRLISLLACLPLDLLYLAPRLWSLLLEPLIILNLNY